MIKINIEKLLMALWNELEDLVANYLDVNRGHVDITFISDLIGEHYYDDEDYGFTSITFYQFGYKYRESMKNLDYEDEKTMVLQHFESEGEGAYDHIITMEEFEKLPYWDED